MEGAGPLVGPTVGLLVGLQVELHLESLEGGEEAVQGHIVEGDLWVEWEGAQSLGYELGDGAELCLLLVQLGYGQAEESELFSC